MPSFDEMYDRLRFLMDRNIPIHVISTKNATYSVDARQLESKDKTGERAIICTIVVKKDGTLPNKPCRIYIHRDCWGNDRTCGNARAGGIYNGNPSIYHWFPD